MNAVDTKQIAQGIPGEKGYFWAPVDKRAFRDSRYFDLVSIRQMPWFQDPKNKKILRPSGGGGFAAVFKPWFWMARTRLFEVYLAGPHAQRSETHYQILERLFSPSCQDRPLLVRPLSVITEEELEVEGTATPILTMEWVQGQQLGAWVAERVQAGEGGSLARNG